MLTPAVYVVPVWALLPFLLLLLLLLLMNQDWIVPSGRPLDPCVPTAVVSNSSAALPMCFVMIYSDGERKSFWFVVMTMTVTVTTTITVTMPAF
jgi:hypothetical protein